jgi:signal transduction histidine kinase/ligand-binding sensor domain-containing protein/DNA-binding response OmpR family regulator
MSATYKTYRRYLFLVCLSVTTFHLFLYAQYDNLRFKHLTIDDGLSQGSVTSIIQDSIGFMWFGTNDGLNRYDGNRFRVFYHDPYDSTSISGRDIRTLHLDAEGTLWIGGRGLDRYIPEKEHFRRYEIPQPSRERRNRVIVTAIYSNKPGILWLGSDAGLIRFDVKTGVFLPFLPDPSQPNKEYPENIRSLIIDPYDILWVATRDGLYALDLHLYSEENEPAFASYSPDHTNRHGLDADNITSLFIDPLGSLWAGTETGLYRFQRDTRTHGSFIHFPHTDTSLKNSWHGRVLSIVDDKYGNFWMATSGGLAIFNPGMQKYQYIFHHPLVPDGLSINGIQALYTDESEHIWIGTVGKGIDIYNQHSKRFHLFRGYPDREPYVSDLSITGLLEDTSGTIWISSQRFLYRFNRTTGDYRQIQLTPSGRGIINHMISDIDNRIWFGTSEGLFLYVPSDETILQYRNDPGNVRSLRDNEIQRVFQDKTGTIHVINGSFISTLDESTDSFTHSPIATPEDVIPAPIIIRDIYETTDGVLWLGSTDGLIRYEIPTGESDVYRHVPNTPNSLSSNDINSITGDPLSPRDILWIGTAGGGLNMFHIPTESFKHYTTRDGLPNNYLYGILTDEKDNFWISTNQGLSRVDPAALRRGEGHTAFQNFDVTDGLQSNEFNTGAYFKNGNGEMYFGGVRGFNIFHPAEIAKKTTGSPIILTDFLLSNRSLTIGHPDSPLEKPIYLTEEMILSYRDNTFALEFTTLDFASPSKRMYAYILENFHKDWISAGNNRVASFTNIKPGKYTFRVRGTNSDGIWGTDEASVRIVITSPPWQSWWAYLLYVSAGFGFIYLLRRYELNRLNLKNLLRLQHIESKKFKELDTLKTRFFANISHELRTPLMLILGPSEQLSGELRDERLAHKANLIQANARRLLRLINQLLDISRLESGKMKLHVELADIVPFTETITMSMTSIAERKQIYLRFNSAEERIAVYFDRDKSEKILINLLSNAIKFTPAGGEVEVTVSIRSKDGMDRVAVEIRDTGIGISGDQLPHIFDRFYQVDSTSTREHEGTGIGLALVKELVDLHRGSIDVISTPGRGSAFTVFFPLGNSHLHPEEIISTDEKSPAYISSDEEMREYIQESDEPDTLSHSGSLKQDETIILIVEDNPAVRAYMREHLEPFYTIIDAKNGAEGFAKAVEQIPDLILSDVMMPGINGYILCNQIKTDERTSHIPVVLLTAKAGLQDKIEGLETGADDYIVKPFESHELLARIKSIIENRRRVREKFTGTIVLKPREVTASSMDRSFLERILNIVEEYLDVPELSVEMLAREAAMSHSQLHRKLKALTNQSANQFIRSVRMQRALELLAKNAGNIAEIAARVGYEDPGYFSRSFRQYFGFLPSEARDRTMQNS